MIVDVTLYKDGQMYVSGDPGEIRRLKRQGWSAERPTEAPSTASVADTDQGSTEAPKAAEVKSTPAKPSTSKTSTTK